MLQQPDLWKPPRRRGQNDLRAPSAPRQEELDYPYTSAYSFAGPLESEGESDVQEYWRILLRNRGVLLVAAAVGAVLGFLSTIPQTPRYRSVTTLEIQSPNEDFMNRRQVDPTMSSGNLETFLETQASLLSSRSLLTRTVEGLGEDRVRSSLSDESWTAAWNRDTKDDQEPAPTSNTLAVKAQDNLSVRTRPGTQLVEVSFE